MRSVLTLERFHIAEWYGRPFHRLDEKTRIELANHQVGGAALSKSEIKRLTALESKAIESSLKTKEIDRLNDLRQKLAKQNAEEQVCPFKADKTFATCTKPGGVCSIRLFQELGDEIRPIEGDRGRLRALCPHRFHQHNTVFKKIGERLLEDADPIRAGEVGFLESTGSLDSDPGEDVGRIDMILVKSNQLSSGRMEWVAVEVQAVYFSGKNMGLEFENLINTGGKLAMPVERRRPDYRSSGVKRLMPQLLTKVPTLRRWAKKMVVVVDAPFFHSLGKMAPERDVSNADIVWIVVDFVENTTTGQFELEVIDEYYTTLENATLGLTGGVPLSQPAFEDRISAKIDKQKLPLTIARKTSTK